MLPYQQHQKLRKAQQGNLSSSPELERLKGLKFWVWNKE